MAGDVATLGNYFPQAGDNTNMLLMRLLARFVRPAEDAVIYLASAARLGTTVGATIDTRGARGILINNIVTAVAGAGTMRVDCATKSNILMGNAATRFMLSAALTVSNVICVHPGQIAIGSSAQEFGCSQLGRYTVLSLVNGSAIAGNEVTSELSYILLY